MMPTLISVKDRVPNKGLRLEVTFRAAHCVGALHNLWTTHRILLLWLLVVICIYCIDGVQSANAITVSGIRPCGTHLSVCVCSARLVCPTVHGLCGEFDHLSPTVGYPAIDFRLVWCGGLSQAKDTSVKSTAGYLAGLRKLNHELHVFQTVVWHLWHVVEYGNCSDLWLC